MNEGKEWVHKAKKRKKAQVNKSYCVACGECMKYCLVGAITVIGGMYAEVNAEKCVGCSRCNKVCPASVIEMV